MSELQMGATISEDVGSSDGIRVSDQKSQRQIGWWQENGSAPVSGISKIQEALGDLNSPLYLIQDSDGRLALGPGGRVVLGDLDSSSKGAPLVAYVPPMKVKNLGDASFCDDLGIRLPYVTGAMANGIASEELVEAVGQAGMLGFFGAAGLSLERLTAAIDRLQASLGANEKAFGFNLIHSPNEPRHEAAVVDLFIKRGVTLIEASAYLDLTLPLVRYRVHGIRRNADGVIEVPNRIVAKASRIEVADKFFSPPPEKFLMELVRSGDITEEQATWAAQIPMAQDLTAESDSGGHTDNRPALTMLPTFVALRNRLQKKHNYQHALRVGAAGGVSTPASAAAAFSLGAAYVMTGSVNQACVESGSSDEVRKMLAEVQQADITMAPAADMFEMGVKLQVLKRGTMFPMRAIKLYDLYRKYDSLEAIPEKDRLALEKGVFRNTLDTIWEQTESFFQKRDPVQVERAARDPKHKMALVFRWYLGMSSRWANTGESSRKMDYQIWCGPAMGAFNEWTRGSFLERPENRTAVAVALNLMYGGAVLQRIQMLRAQGIAFSPEVLHLEPLALDEVSSRLT